MKKETKYFKSSEFDCPSFPGSGIHMSDELVDLLDQLRERVGRPVSISSGFRTREHNDDLISRGYKASQYSEHLQGNAVDIVVKNSGEKYEIVKTALEIGFTRIGISSNFVHLDLGDRAGRKDGFVIWTY